MTAETEDGGRATAPRPSIPFPVRGESAIPETPPGGDRERRQDGNHSPDTAFFRKFCGESPYFFRNAVEK